MIAFLSVDPAGPTWSQGRPGLRLKDGGIRHHYEGIITMTSTQEGTRPVRLVGQAVGEAQASLKKILTGILAESGTGYQVAAGLAGTGPAGVGGGAIRLTARGRELRGEVLAASAKITEPMLAAIDRGDLETTVRTLDEITRRARGIPAGPVTTEGNR